MNRRQVLDRARLALSDKLNEDAPLEGEILLRHVLGIDRAALFASADADVTRGQLNELDKLVARRLKGEPSAYITGHKEFYGLDFKVDKRVLIPRPETELLVENAICYCRQYGFSSIADIGTGSGCIAISLAVNLPEVSVFTTDVSLLALEVAKENSISYGVKGRINFLIGDLLQPLLEPVEMIVANLPYVKKADITSLFEPEQALDGGEEGLDTIIELCRQLPGKLKPYGILLLEIGQGQVKAVTAILHNLFPSAIIQIKKDLAGIERVISLRLTS